MLLDHVNLGFHLDSGSNTGKPGKSYCLRFVQTNVENTKHYCSMPNGREVHRITSCALLHLQTDCFCEVKIKSFADRYISVLSKHLKRIIPQRGMLVMLKIISLLSSCFTHLCAYTYAYTWDC